MKINFQPLLLAAGLMLPTASRADEINLPVDIAYAPTEYWERIIEAKTIAEATGRKIDALKLAKIWGEAMQASQSTKNREEAEGLVRSANIAVDMANKTRNELGPNDRSDWTLTACRAGLEFAKKRLEDYPTGTKRLHQPPSPTEKP